MFSVDSLCRIDIEHLGWLTKALTVRPPQDRGEDLNYMGSVHSALHMYDTVGQPTGCGGAADRSAVTAVVAGEELGGWCYKN